MSLLSLTQKTNYNETIHIRNNRNIRHGILRLAILEFLLTFFLMMVIINVSTGSKEIDAMVGIAFGGDILLEAMFAGPITKASMISIRSIAPALFTGNF